ncbi:MAG TPA: hypothetical protein VGF67_26130 [Ktedonobacteraceae bacterium]|jgi:hypothetical protein
MMQKWEYLVIRGEHRGGQFMPRFINDQEQRDWKRASLPFLLNQPGNDGWELVGAVGYSTGYYDNELLLKRPRP